MIAFMSLRLIIFFVFTIYLCSISYTKNRIYLASFLVFIYFLYPETYIWGIKEYRIVFLLNISLALFLFLNKEFVNPFQDKLSKYFFFFFVSVVLSAFAAKGSKDLSLDYAFLFFKVYLFWVLLRSCLCSEKNINFFYWVCLLSITLLSAWGIQQYILGNIRLEGFGGGQIVGSNQIAAAMVWAVPIAFFFTIKYKGYLRLFCLACLIILLGGIVCTESRQAIVALVLCLPFYFKYVKYKSSFILGGILLTILATCFIPQEFYQRMETIQTYEEDASAQGRLEQWRGAYRMFLDYPLLGVGGRNYYHLAHNYVSHPRVTHNTYFQILSEEGFVGISIFLTLMVATLFRAKKLIKQSLAGEISQSIFYYAAIAQLSLIGLLVICLFQNKAEHEYLYWPIAVIAALSSPSLLTQYDQKQKDKNKCVE